MDYLTSQYTFPLTTSLLEAHSRPFSNIQPSSHINQTRNRSTLVHFICGWAILHNPLLSFQSLFFVIRHEHMFLLLAARKQQPIGVLRTDGKKNNMVATLRLRRFQPLLGAISSLSSFRGTYLNYIFYFACKLYEYTSFSFSNGHGYLPNWAIQFPNCSL